MRPEITFIDHTGDTGIHFYADSLHQVFETAAFGMFQIICPHYEIQSILEKEITIEGGDLEECLVYWLSELNFLFQTQQYMSAKILKMDRDGYRFSMLVSGETFDPEKHNAEIEIKAVTFHKLMLEEQDHRWQVRVIFDI